MTASYKTRHGSVSVCAQPSDLHALIDATPAQFAATAQGAADGTTVVSTALTGATAAIYVGNVIECVATAAGSLANLHCRAMVRAFNQATDTLTIDALPDQVEIGDVFRMYATCDGVVVATSAVVGGATIIATGRTEANDYWDGTAQEGGYYVAVENADNAPQTAHPLVSNWVAGTNTITLGTSFGVDVAIGDLFRLEKHIEPAGIVIVPADRPDVPRETTVGSYGHEAATPGLRGATVALELHDRGPGLGREGSTTEAHEFLRCLFSPDDVGNLTVNAASSLTSITYDAGSADVGEMFITATGDALMCVADSGTAVTPSPKLRAIPAEDSTCYGMMTYTPGDAPQKALALYGYVSRSVERHLYGCMPTIAFSAETGQPTKITVSLQAGDYYDHVLDHAAAAVERDWYPRLPSVDALKTRDGRIALWDGTTLVELPFHGWTFDPGIELKRIVDLASPNDFGGWEISNISPRGTIRTRLTSMSRRFLKDFEAKKSWSIGLQAGRTPGHPGVLAVWCYDVTFDAVPLSDDAGELVLEIPFSVNRSEAGLALGLPQFAIGKA